MKKDIVIVGAGHSGGMLAIALRRNLYSGSILLIGKEPHLPYQRPPLSKGFLLDEIRENSLMLKSLDYYKKNSIDLLLPKTVESINPSKQIAILNDGKKIHFSKLVFATGSKLNKININSKTKGILYLRTVNDSKKIRKQLKKSKSIIVIGAGYIGLEISAIARKMGIETTVIEMGPKLMGRVVCSEVSDFLRKKHEENGVNFLLNTTVKDIIQYQNKKRVIFTDESYADTDVVIVGVGIQPNDSLAKKIGIKCNNGIVVDSFGETSIKNIFAIGDCSNKYNNIYKKRLRLESVQNAVDQAQMLSSFILGNTKLKTTVPWFWSDQYDIKLQIAGVSSGYDSYEIKGSIDEERFSISYKKNNTLIALDAINDPKSFMAAKKIIRNNT